MAKSQKFAVIVQTHGQNPKSIMVGSSATVRTALIAAGFQDDALGAMRDSIRVNAAGADLTQRLKKDDYLTVTPKVAGGR